MMLLELNSLLRARSEGKQCSASETSEIPFFHWRARRRGGEAKRNRRLPWFLRMRKEIDFFFSPSSFCFCTAVPKNEVAGNQLLSMYYGKYLQNMRMRLSIKVQAELYTTFSTYFCLYTSFETQSKGKTAFIDNKLFE